MKFGNVKKVIDGDISYSIIDKKHSSEDMIKTFGSFRFPLQLFEKTKLEIKREYDQLGIEKAVKKTWFCHRPINYEPCGTCNPCKSVVEEGVAFRLSKKSLKRYENEIWKV